jgi:uncharacterized protein YhaN
MAEQPTNKVRKQAATSRGKAKRSKSADGSLEARLAAAEAERDRLRIELDTALERIAMLERANSDVSDRIAWVIDSLQNLTKS